VRILGGSLVPVAIALSLCAPLGAATAPKKTAVAVPSSTMLPCTAAKPSGLPLPSTYSKNNDPAAYQQVVTNFLRSYTYQNLGWCEDKTVRDTGPYLNNNYYGTHPAVRVWYSPEVAKWVLNGRQGALPDGAMIIKEQFSPAPAAQYEGWTKEQLHAYFDANYDWTFMIRDSKGSADGWYWGEIYAGKPDSYAPPFAVFNVGFGLYCLRCHASAESELTFSAETNFKGRPGNFLIFVDDNSWFANRLKPPKVPATPLQSAANDASASTAALDTTDQTAAAEPSPHALAVHDPNVVTHPHSSSAVLAMHPPHTTANSDWMHFFKETNVNAQPNPLPGENYDHIVSPPGKPQHFLTYDQCFGCHSGNRVAGTPMMMVDTRDPSDPLVNISPWAEWRWSPMGLAGRDPVFYAQLDSEIAYLDAHKPEEKVKIVNLCFSCHNAMGERQLEMTSGGKEPYTTEFPMVRNLQDPRFPYGALGRDGISCTICHHIKNTDDKTEMEFIEQDATGRFQLTEPGQLGGPFEKPATTPMKHALNIIPVLDKYTQNARICGTCHTIHLPVLDAIDEPAKKAQAEECQSEKFSYEQATYLEWVNSAFQNVINDPSRFVGGVQTCQDCHMSGALNGITIETKIAAVEDTQYPNADHLAPLDELNVPIRSNYARHQFQGLNVYLLELFNQFSDPLGVRTCDYMSSGCSGKNPISDIPFAQRNFLEQASQQTATLAVSAPAMQGSTLTADVSVTNLTGHRFPSGVSFRRAFIDFAVVDKKSKKVLFESGATNSIGAIVDMQGNVLPSEYNGSTGPNGRAYQPHYWAPANSKMSGNPITRDNQVQIFEELLKDADGNFTTSFIRQDCHFKDNRILPLGWRKDGPDLKKFFGKPLKETWSDGTGDDPHYQDPLGGKGQAVVRYSVALPAGTKLEDVDIRAQLYYQAIPPYFLLQRFQQAPNGMGTQRLYYMTSMLDTTKTPFPGWKLLVAQATP